MTKDYRIDFKVRNNWLLSVIESRGYKTVGEFCRKNNLQATTVGKYAALKISPLTSDGEWTSYILKMAEILKCLPSELCPPQHLEKSLRVNTATIEADVSEVAGYLTGNIDTSMPAISHIIDDENCLEITKCLTLLTPREERVLRMRFGLTPDGEVRELQEVGNDYGLSRERIRQVEAKALRKLKHPKRSAPLREVAKAWGITSEYYDNKPRHYVPEWKKQEQKEK